MMRSFIDADAVDVNTTGSILSRTKEYSPDPRPCVAASRALVRTESDVLLFFHVA
jgi:hypothetical protein